MTAQGRPAILYFGFNFDSFEGVSWAKIHLKEKLDEDEWDFDYFPLVFMRKHSELRFYTLLKKHQKHLQELGTTMLIQLATPPSDLYAEED